MANKKPLLKRKRTVVNSSKARGSKSRAARHALGKTDIRPDTAADPHGIRGEVVYHVHGAIRNILGQALKQMDTWKDFEGQQEVTLRIAGERQALYAAQECVPASVAEPVELEPEPVKPSPIVRNTDASDPEHAAAKVLLMKLRQQSNMCRAKHTVMFYLEELGRLRAFDGRTTDMNKLSGRNLETTRKCIVALITEKAVCKDPHSTKIRNISLTPLGKRAYFLHTGEVEEPVANAMLSQP